MSTFHSKLISLRKALGYKSNISTDRGSCGHYAEKAIDAWLVGPHGYNTFLKRREFIEKNYELLPAMIQKIRNDVKVRAKKINNDRDIFTCRNVILTEEEYQVLDVAAFMEGDLYQYPELYKSVFNKSLSQSQTTKISEFAEPEDLKMRGGRTLLASYGSIYTKAELTEYFALLNIYANTSLHDFAMILHSDNHVISLCYNAVQKKWTFVDANDPYPLANIGIKVDDLTNKIFNAFEFTSEAKITGFNTKIFASKDHEKQLQPIIDAFTRSDTFKSLHEITHVRALRYTSRGATLASFAAQRRGLATLTKLAMLAKNDDKTHVERIDLNKPNKKGITPLHIAASEGHVDVLRILVEAKVDINVANNDGTRAVFMAAQYGYIDALKTLIEAKADLNIPRNDGITSVFMAAQNGHADTLKILGEAGGVNFNIPDKNGANAIYIAAQNGHEDALQVLLKTNANINKSTNMGTTPVCIAVKNNHTKTAKVLAEAKADLNIPTNDGWYPIHLATYFDNMAIITLLAEHGADLEKVNKNLNPLNIAEAGNQMDAVRFFKDWEQRNKVMYKGDLLPDNASNSKAYRI